MIIDGKNLIMGRAAAFIAKQSLMGEKVDVVNCNEMLITGNKREIIAKYKRKKSMGVPSKGPFQPKKPDMFVRKVIRGMLPYKQFKGREAFKRVRCHIGFPETLKGEAQTIKNASINKVPNLKYIKVETVCKELGWQK
ncbi:50S ribosomal protein L13 [Candidatus Woesearchaeota archaeon B3_Woes]|nr:MAG: 50S ribosomal protein L13 [Candidatus Woesearchaeota archaeon B3_Woes]